MVASPRPSSTTAIVCRVVPRTSTISSRRPEAARSARSAVPAAPPARPVTTVLWPSAASTRATLIPLPPARRATERIRWLVPGRIRSTA